MTVKKSIAVICGDITAVLNRRPQLMQRFKEIDPDVRIVCPSHEEKYLDSIRELGFDLHVIENNKQSLNPMTDMAYYRQVKKFLVEHRPTDVFVFHMKPVLWAALACQKLGINCHCLFAGLGYVFSEESSFKRKIAKFLASKLMKRSLKKASTIFFQNPDDRQTFDELGILPADGNVEVVNGSGVSMEHFPQVEPRVEDPVVFLLVARILRDKGIPEYYEAGKRLKKKYGDKVELQLLGPFDDNPNIMDRSQIDAWDREGTVKYLGVTDDVRSYLQNMSVFTLPSFYMEGTPKTILESLATGRPVITTDSRGCRETVKNGVNGFLIPPRDVDALYNAMEHFVEDRTAIKEMGIASFRLAQTKYDVNKVNHFMLECMNLIPNSDSTVE